MIFLVVGLCVTLFFLGYVTAICVMGHFFARAVNRKCTQETRQAFRREMGWDD